MGQTMRAARKDKEEIVGQWKIGHLQVLVGALHVCSIYKYSTNANMEEKRPFPIADLLPYNRSSLGERSCIPKCFTSTQIYLSASFSHLLLRHTFASSLQLGGATSSMH